MLKLKIKRTKNDIIINKYLMNENENKSAFS